MLRGCAVLLLVVFGLAACGGSSKSGAPATTAVPVANAGAAVSLKNIAFNPSMVTIKAGQAVVWTWHDGSVPHDVSGQGYASALQSKGTFSHTFPDPGTFKYTCTIHSGMDGTVTVTP
jgi:plastocyanin